MNYAAGIITSTIKWFKLLASGIQDYIKNDPFGIQVVAAAGFNIASLER